MLTKRKEEKKHRPSNATLLMLRDYFCVRKFQKRHRYLIESYFGAEHFAFVNSKNKSLSKQLSKIDAAAEDIARANLDYKYINDFLKSAPKPQKKKMEKKMNDEVDDSAKEYRLKDETIDVLKNHLMLKRFYLSDYDRIFDDLVREIELFSPCVSVFSIDLVERLDYAMNELNRHDPEHYDYKYLNMMLQKP